MRRDAFLDAGGFSDVLHFVGEEELLALDLAAAGWGLAYVPELVVHHHPSKTGRDPAGRRRREIRNRLLTAWLRRPLPAVARTAASALTSRDGRAGLAAAVRALPSVAPAAASRPPSRRPGRDWRGTERSGPRRGPAPREEQRAQGADQGHGGERPSGAVLGVPGGAARLGEVRNSVPTVAMPITWASCSSVSSSPLASAASSAGTCRSAVVMMIGITPRPNPMTTVSAS